MRSVNVQVSLRRMDLQAPEWAVVMDVLKILKVGAGVGKKKRWCQEEETGWGESQKLALVMDSTLHSKRFEGSQRWGK